MEINQYKKRLKFLLNISTLNIICKRVVTFSKLFNSKSWTSSSKICNWIYNLQKKSARPCKRDVLKKTFCYYYHTPSKIDYFNVLLNEIFKQMCAQDSYQVLILSSITCSWYAVC